MPGTFPACWAWRRWRRATATTTVPWRELPVKTMRRWATWRMRAVSKADAMKLDLRISSLYGLAVSSSLHLAEGS